MRGLRELAPLARRLACSQPAAAQWQGTTGSSSVHLQQLREHGGGVPEFWGKESKYTAGTTFLGTPQDHYSRLEKRPISPHVFNMDSPTFHYAMPVNAISSIMNRATGVMLSVGVTGVGWVALTGDLPGAVAALKASSPWLVYPIKAAIAGPMVYHYLGGIRHLVWDQMKIGRQSAKGSVMEYPAVVRSSWAIIYGSAAGTLALAALSF